MYKKIAFLLWLQLIASCIIFPISDNNRELFMAELQSRYGQLHHENSYQFFDLQLSDDEHATLESLMIDKNLQFHSFGNINNLQEEVALFLQSLGNDHDVAWSCSAIIYQRVHATLEVLGVQEVWVTIRACCSSCVPNMVRWHIDEYPKSSFVCSEYKMVYALKGYGTLFCDVPDDVRSQFFATQSLRKNRVYRKRQVDTKGLSHDASLQGYISESQVVGRLLAPYEVKQTPQGCGALFIIGNRDDAVIHSEPDSLSNRLFVAIVPGPIS